MLNQNSSQQPHTPTSLAIIVLNYRTPGLALDATQAAINAAAELGGQWVVLLIDNHSEDGSDPLFRTHVAEKQRRDAPGWERVSVLQTGHNGGFGAGNNYGIRHAVACFPDLRYVYILNSDAFPKPGAIGALVNFLDAHPGHAFVGSSIHGIDGEPHVTAFRFPTAYSEFEGAARLGPVTRLLRRHRVPLGEINSSCDVDWTAGASLLMRVEALQEIGLFDENFFLYFEETDLCLRARRAGWLTHYLVESEVTHIGSASTGMQTWESIPAYWYDSRKYYFKKNHGAAYFGIATFCHVLGGCLHWLRCVIQRRARNAPRGTLRQLTCHALTRNV